MPLSRAPSNDTVCHGLSFSAVSLMLSFRAMFHAGRARGLDLSLGFRFGPDAFSVRVRAGAIECFRGEPGRVDVMLAGAPSVVLAGVYRLAPLPELEADGSLTVEGDRQALARFSAIFELPPKAG